MGMRCSRARGIGGLTTVRSTEGKPVGTPVEVQRKVCMGGIALFLILLVPPAGAQPGDDRVPDQILLETKGNVSIDTILERYNLTLLDAIPPFHIWQVRVAPGDDVDAILLLMIDDGDLRTSEPHRHLESPEGVQRSLSDIDLTTTSDAFRNQDGASIIGTSSAHTRYTGEGITVAVLDTGMAMDHPETSSQILGPGADFAGGDGTAIVQANGIDDDEDGLVDESAEHGTHVAGLVNLSAPDAEILPVRVLEADGKGTSFGLTNAIIHATNQRVDVINISMGMILNSKFVERAIEDAVDLGIAVVVSAGNRGINGVDFPAFFPEVITVAAVDQSRKKPAFSSFGTQVALSAPGVDVISTHGDENYARWSGTSFAAPLVAGGVALLMEKYPGLNPFEIRAALQSAAQDDQNGSELEGLMGAGVLDLDALTRILTTDRASVKAGRTSAGIVLSWSPVLDANVYDVARGDVANLRPEVQLGPLTCIADDVQETDTANFPDPDIPAPGQTFFYVFRDDALDPGGGSYGVDSNDHPRVAGESDCPGG